MPRAGKSSQKPKLSYRAFGLERPLVTAPLLLVFDGTLDELQAKFPDTHFVSLALIQCANRALEAALIDLPLLAVPCVFEYKSRKGAFNALHRLSFLVPWSALCPPTVLEALIDAGLKKRTARHRSTLYRDKYALWTQEYLRIRSPLLLQTEALCHFQTSLELFDAYNAYEPLEESL